MEYTNKLEQELKDFVMAEIDLSPDKEFLKGISNQYFEHYFNQSPELQAKFRRLTSKYNNETILNFLGKNSYPDFSVHMSLGHDVSDKDLFAQLDNDGAIYPPDLEIGQITKGASFRDKNDTDSELNLRLQFDETIFYSWLSINWMVIKGFEAKIVVKTTENNSIRSWYLNDFQFDRNSGFDRVQNWRDAILRSNMEKIGIPELIANVRKGV